MWTSLGGIAGDQEFFSATAPHAHLLADLFATRYVLLPPGERAPGWLIPVFRTQGGTVAINSTALPRAWVAYRWRSVPAEINDWALTVTSTTSRLLDRPVIEGAPASPAGVAPPPTVATIASDGTEAVTVDATARRAGYLILNDSAYPGWHASLDGHSVQWTPANENFRAVPVPAGRHVIRFSYRPASVLVGTIVTALCVVALIALAVFGFVWVRRLRNSSMFCDSVEGRAAGSSFDAGRGPTTGRPRM